MAETTPFSAVDGPGNRFVVFLQGCNFDCIACHNPQTIPGHEPLDGHEPQRLGVDDLLVGIRRAIPFISGITASGGEATQQPDFVHDLFAAVKADEQLAHLTCMVDSNGACGRATWDLLAPVMDGAMIDLKCLDPVIHERLTGQPNDQVLDSIRYLASLERLYEVRLLLVGGINDDPMVLRRTAEWLAAIDPEMRVKIIGFRHHGVRPHDPPLIDPLPEDLGAAASVLRDVAAFDVAMI